MHSCKQCTVTSYTAKTRMTDFIDLEELWIVDGGESYSYCTKHNQHVHEYTCFRGLRHDTQEKNLL